MTIPHRIEPKPRTYVRGILPRMLRMSDSVGTHSIHGLTSGDLRRYFKDVVDSLLADKKARARRYVSILGIIINQELAFHWVYRKRRPHPLLRCV